MFLALPVSVVNIFDIGFVFAFGGVGSGFLLLIKSVLLDFVLIFLDGLFSGCSLVRLNCV